MFTHRVRFAKRGICTKNSHTDSKFHHLNESSDSFNSSRNFSHISRHFDYSCCWQSPSGPEVLMQPSSSSFTISKYVRFLRKISTLCLLDLPVNYGIWNSNTLIGFKTKPTRSILHTMYEPTQSKQNHTPTVCNEHTRNERRRISHEQPGSFHRHIRPAHGWIPKQVPFT